MNRNGRNYSGSTEKIHKTNETTTPNPTPSRPKQQPTRPSSHQPQKSRQFHSKPSQLHQSERFKRRNDKKSRISTFFSHSSSSKAQYSTFRPLRIPSNPPSTLPLSLPKRHFGLLNRLATALVQSEKKREIKKAKEGGLLEEEQEELPFHPSAPVKSINLGTPTPFDSFSTNLPQQYQTPQTFPEVEQSMEFVMGQKVGGEGPNLQNLSQKHEKGSKVIKKGVKPAPFGAQNPSHQDSYAAGELKPPTSSQFSNYDNDDSGDDDDYILGESKHQTEQRNHHRRQKKENNLQFDSITTASPIDWTKNEIFEQEDVDFAEITKNDLNTRPIMGKNTIIIGPSSHQKPKEQRKHTSVPKKDLGADLFDKPGSAVIKSYYKKPTKVMKNEQNHTQDGQNGQNNDKNGTNNTQNAQNTTTTTTMESPTATESIAPTTIATTNTQQNESNQQQNEQQNESNPQQTDQTQPQKSSKSSKSLTSFSDDESDDAISKGNNSVTNYVPNQAQRRRREQADREELRKKIHLIPSLPSSEFSSTQWIKHNAPFLSSRLQDHHTGREFWSNRSLQEDIITSGINPMKSSGSHRTLPNVHQEDTISAPEDIPVGVHVYGDYTAEVEEDGEDLELIPDRKYRRNKTLSPEELFEQKTQKRRLNGKFYQQQRDVKERIEAGTFKPYKPKEGTEEQLFNKLQKQSNRLHQIKQAQNASGLQQAQRSSNTRLSSSSGAVGYKSSGDKGTQSFEPGPISLLDDLNHDHNDLEAEDGIIQTPVVPLEPSMATSQSNRKTFPPSSSSYSPHHSSPTHQKHSNLPLTPPTSPVTTSSPSSRSTLGGGDFPMPTFEFKKIEPVVKRNNKNNNNFNPTNNSSSSTPQPKPFSPTIPNTPSTTSTRGFANGIRGSSRHYVGYIKQEVPEPQFLTKTMINKYTRDDMHITSTGDIT